jgi:hypothetical protein
MKEEEEIDIAKYVPHMFEWKYMDEKEVIIEKKKKKEMKVNACE